MLRFASAATVAGLVLCGCGGDDAAEVPEFSGSDEQQVAKTVNAMFDAIAANDGATACGLMTDRGQRIWVKIITRNPESGGSGDTCEEAADTVDWNGLAEYEDVRAGDVSIEVAGERATVTNDFGGMLTAESVDGTWLVDVPMFVN